jgi:PST family polysaccharide transporter
MAVQAEELAETLPSAPSSVSGRSERSVVASDELKGRTVRGGVAKMASQAATFIARIGSLMILARLLEPEDFGLVAMVTVVTGIFSLFKDAGLSLATVQRPSIDEEQLSALFWINMLVGVILAALTITASPALAAFYSEPRLVPIGLTLSLGFILNGAGVQHSALLQRQMRFTAIAAIEITSQVLSSAVGIAMALFGYGYWSLVVMALLLPGAWTIGAWLVAQWIPGRPRWAAEVRSMLGFGGKVSLNVLIVYVAYNVDKVLLGRLAGAEVLGLYGRAYQLINIPTENLNTAVGGVALAALSRIQDDTARFRSYFLKSYSMVLALTIPVTVACALFASELVFVLLGPKWTSAATIFRLLAPTILAFAMINPVTWLLFSTGKVDRSLKMAVVIAPLVIAAEIIGVRYGAVGIAFAYSLCMALLAVPMILWAIHDSVVSVADMIAAARPPLAAIAMATVAMAVMRVLVGPLASPFLNLLAYGGVLLTVYLWALLYAMRQHGFYFGLLRELRGRA